MTFDEALQDEYCLKILNLLRRWLPKLPADELKQLQLIALWEASSTFDESYNCKFITHLYNRVRFKYLKHINRKSNHLLGHTGETFFSKHDLNLNLFFDGLSERSRSLLEDRFVNKLSLHEMARKYQVKWREIPPMIEAAKEEFLKVQEC